jgi:hypothetical protein
VAIKAIFFEKANRKILNPHQTMEQILKSRALRTFELGYTMSYTNGAVAPADFMKDIEELPAQ